MAESDKNNKNWSVFAIMFTTVFGFLYGIFKITENTKGRNQEIQKLNEMIREGLEFGLTDDQMIQGFYQDASRQLKKELTVADKENIRDIFYKEKKKIEAKNK